ncbi:unnamed protein product [Linum trigynum]|uniref:Uncharacterized protein n=1 Tax=Linum trigynum TaxID=586398 RepID=A0AAV2E1S2_9ROSI
MNGKEKEEVEEEEENIEKGENLDCSHKEESEQEGMEVEEEEEEGASGVQDEDEVGVDEASTSYKCYQYFLPDLDALLEKEPFAALCQAKAKPPAIHLGGCDGSQSMMDYMVWGQRERRGKEEEVSWVEPHDNSSSRALNHGFIQSS